MYTNQLSCVLPNKFSFLLLLADSPLPPPICSSIAVPRTFLSPFPPGPPFPLLPHPSLQPCPASTATLSYPPLSYPPQPHLYPTHLNPTSTPPLSYPPQPHLCYVRSSTIALTMQGLSLGLCVHVQNVLHTSRDWEDL